MGTQQLSCLFLPFSKKSQDSVCDGEFRHQLSRAVCPSIWSDVVLGVSVEDACGTRLACTSGDSE